MQINQRLYLSLYEDYQGSILLREERSRRFVEAGVSVLDTAISKLRDRSVFVKNRSVGSVVKFMILEARLNFFISILVSE